MSLVTAQDIQDISSRLYSRLEFSNKGDETKYQEQIKIVKKRYPDEGPRIPEQYTIDMDSLRNGKLRTIRKQLNDDNGFVDLYKKLNDLNFTKTKKEQEQEALIKQKGSILKRMSGFLGNNMNSVDNTKNLQDEISMLTKIIYNLEMLNPIYKMDGGKRKSRRSKKTKKNHKKSKMYFIQLNPIQSIKKRGQGVPPS